MTRNLEAVGLAALALVATSAVLASTASAQFESEAEITYLTVSSNQTQKVEVKAGGSPTPNCATLASDNAVITGTATTTLEFTATFSNCESLLGQPVTIDTNGCAYVLHLADNATSGTTDIECPTSTGIQLTIGSLCTYEFDTQTGLGSISYKNIGSATTREIEVQPNVKGIASSRTTNHFPFSCPAGSSEGTYTGNFVLTGENVSGVDHRGIFVD